MDPKRLCHEKRGQKRKKEEKTCSEKENIHRYKKIKVK
jgi:hypothetical protein